MTLHLLWVMKAIKVFAILESLCSDWNEDMPVDDRKSPDPPDAGNDTRDRQNQANIRDCIQLMQGKAKRRRLLDQMSYH